MARPQKSEVQHETEGTTLRSSVRDSHVPASIPRPPKGLSKDAKKKFKEICKLLAPRRAITIADADIITLYIGCWTRLQQAQLAVETEGLIVQYERLDRTGVSRTISGININLRIVEACEKQCLAYLTRLGLTPKDRALVTPTAPAAPKNEPSEADKNAAEIERLRKQIELEQSDGGVSDLNIDDLEIKL